MNILEAILPELKKAIKQINNDHKTSITIHPWVKIFDNSQFINIYYSDNEKTTFITINEQDGTTLYDLGTRLHKQHHGTQIEWTNPDFLQKTEKLIKAMATDRITKIITR